MAQEILTGEQLIAQGYLDKAIADAEKLIQTYGILEQGIRNIATITKAKLPITDPATIDDVIQLQQATDKLDNSLKGLNDIQKQILITKEKQRQLSALQRADIKGEISAYQALQNSATQANRAAKDAGATFGINSKQYKDAALSANLFNNQLKTIDQGLGQYQRNVGNYSRSIGVLGRSLRGLGGLGYILGNAIGIDPSVAEGIREAGRAVIDLHHAEDIEKLTKEENIGLTEADTLATKENTAAKEVNNTVTEETASLLGALKLGFLALGVVAITYVIENFKKVKELLGGLTDKQKLLNEINQEAISLYAGETEKTKELLSNAQDLNLSYNVRNENIAELKKEYPGLLDDMTVENSNNEKYASIINDKVIPAIKARALAEAGFKVFEKANEAYLEAYGKLTDKQKLQVDLQEHINDLAKKGQTLLKGQTIFTFGGDAVGDAITNAIKLKKAADDAFNTYVQFDKQYQKDRPNLGTGAAGDGSGNDELLKAKARAETTLSYTNENTKKQLNAKLTLSKAQEAIDVDDAKKANKSADEITAIQSKALKERRDEALKYRLFLKTTREQDAEINISEIKNASDRELAELNLKEEKELQAIKGTSDAENKLYVDTIEKFDKLREQNRQNKKDNEAVTTAQAGVDLANPGSGSSIYTAKLALIQAEYQKEIDLANQHGEDLVAINAKYQKQLLDAQKTYQDSIFSDILTEDDAEIENLQTKNASKEKIRKAELDKLKNERDKAIIDAEGNRAKIDKANADYAAGKKKLSDDVTKEEIDNIQKITTAFSQELQLQLEAQKKNNDEKLKETDYEIQQQLILQAAGRKNTADFLLAQQAQEQAKAAQLDKQAKQAKEAEQLANIFLEAVKANAGKGPQALALALSETLAAKAIADGLAGHFEGTEDTGAGEGFDSKNGMLRVLHPHEAVIKRSENEAYPGLAKAFNTGNVEDWVLDNFYPTMPRIKDESPTESLAMTQTKILIDEIKNLKEVVKNKKEIAVGETLRGDFYISETENGKQVVAIKPKPTWSNNPVPFPLKNNRN